MMANHVQVRMNVLPVAVTKSVISQIVLLLGVLVSHISSAKIQTQSIFFVLEVNVWALGGPHVPHILIATVQPVIPSVMGLQTVIATVGNLQTGVTNTMF